MHIHAGSALIQWSWSLTCWLGKKLEFHGTDTDNDTDIDTDRESSRGCRRVRRLPRSACHEPNTHDDPRRLVRHARFSSRGSWRGCPLGMRACTRVNVYCKLYNKLSLYTIGASLMSVSVSVPWNSSLNACRGLLVYQLRCRLLEPILLECH